MVITFHGGEAFRVQFGDIVIAFNPPGKRSSLKTVRFGADIVLVTADHPDFNGADQIGIGERQPMVIQGPGEYEVKGVFVRGFAAETMYGGVSLINTIYTVALEGMNICFLGPLSGDELPKDLRQALEHIDILFVPIGGDGALSPGAAARLAVSVEPSIVIPMHFGDIGEKSALPTFLKEMGAKETSPVDKLTLKKRDLDGKQGEVVILSSVA